MKAQVISFKCVLKNHLGQVLSSTFNHDVLTSAPGQTGLLDGLARGLQDIKKGEKRQIRLGAGDAYGFYDPKKIFVRSRDEVPGDVRKGDQIEVFHESGGKSFVLVEDVSDDVVTFDGNHPFAGQDLIFEIEALEAREATDEEIAESTVTMKKAALH